MLPMNDSGKKRESETERKEERKEDRKRWQRKRERDGCTERQKEMAEKDRARE